MIIVGIDPAIRSPGIAVIAGGCVVACDNVRVPAGLKSTDLEVGARVEGVAELAYAWLVEKIGPNHDGHAVTVVYEWPQVYNRTKRASDPNDLLKVVAVGAAVCAKLARTYTVIARTPTPREWAGQSKKDTKGDPWASQRGGMVARRLVTAERAVVPAQHDALDACALALWGAGRFDPVCVYPGASEG